MTNPSAKSPASTPPKRVNSIAYRRRVKRMVALLSLGEPLSRAERAAQSHFWLDASFEEGGGRRMRSPSERLVDAQKDAAPY